MCDLRKVSNIEDICSFNPEFKKRVRTVFRILIQLYVSIKMKENESKSK